MEVRYGPVDDQVESPENGELVVESFSHVDGIQPEGIDGGISLSVALSLVR